MDFHAQLAKFVFNETTDEEELLLIKEELLKTPYWIVIKDYIKNSKEKHGFKRSKDYLDWISKDAKKSLKVKQIQLIPTQSLN